MSFLTWWVIVVNFSQTVDPEAWSCLKMTQHCTLPASSIPPNLTLKSVYSLSGSLCTVFLKYDKHTIHFSSQVRHIFPRQLGRSVFILHGFTLIIASFNSSVWALRLFLHSHPRIHLHSFQAGGKSFSAAFVSPHNRRLCTVHALCCHIISVLPSSLTDDMLKWWVLTLAAKL